MMTYFQLKFARYFAKRPVNMTLENTYWNTGIEIEMGKPAPLCT